MITYGPYAIIRNSIRCGRRCWACGAPLRSYRWSSYPLVRHPVGKRPVWLRSERGMGIPNRWTLTLHKMLVKFFRS